MKLVVIVLFASLVAVKAVGYPNLDDELYNHKLAPIYRMKMQADDVITDIRKVEEEENWRTLRETVERANPSEVDKKEDQVKDKSETDRSIRDVATDTSGKGNELEKPDGKGLKQCWRFARNVDIRNVGKVESKGGNCNIKYSRSVQIDEDGISEEDSKIVRVLRNAAKGRTKPNKAAKRAKGKAKGTRLPRNPTDDVDKESKTEEERKEVRRIRDTPKSDDKESKVEEQPKGKDENLRIPRDTPEGGDKKTETEKRTKREDNLKAVDEKQGEIEQQNVPKQQEEAKERSVRNTPTGNDNEGKIEEQTKEKTGNIRFLRDTLEKSEEKAEEEETGKKSVRFLRDTPKNIDDQKKAEDQSKEEAKNRFLRDTQEGIETKGEVEEKKEKESKNVRMRRNTLEETKDDDKTKGEQEEKKKEIRSAQKHGSCNENEEKTFTKFRRNAPRDPSGLQNEEVPAGLRSRFLRDTPEDPSSKESAETQQKGEKTVRKLRDAPNKPEDGNGEGKVEEQQAKESKNVRFLRNAQDKSNDEEKASEKEDKVEEERAKNFRLARDTESNGDGVQNKEQERMDATEQQKEENKNVRLHRNTLEGNSSDKKEGKNRVHRQGQEDRDGGTCKDLHKKFRRETVEDTKTGSEEQPKEEKRTIRNNQKHEDHFCQWKDDNDRIHPKVNREVGEDTKSSSDVEKGQKQ